MATSRWGCVKTQNGVYKLALPLESCHWSPRNESHLWTALSVPLCLHRPYRAGSPSKWVSPLDVQQHPPLPGIHSIREHSNPTDNLPKPARGQRQTTQAIKGSVKVLHGPRGKQGQSSCLWGLWIPPPISGNENHLLKTNSCWGGWSGGN